MGDIGAVVAAQPRGALIGCNRPGSPPTHLGFVEESGLRGQLVVGFDGNDLDALLFESAGLLNHRQVFPALSAVTVMEHQNAHGEIETEPSRRDHPPSRSKKQRPIGGLAMIHRIPFAEGLVWFVDCLVGEWVFSREVDRPAGGESEGEPEPHAQHRPLHQHAE